MNKLYPLAALPLCCAATAAVAQNKLEEVVVISSRVKMPLRQTGTAISIVGKEEIQQRGFNSLAEILRSQPAIAVSSNGAAGKPAALRIRGEEGFRTLMLIDGIEMSDPSGTQVGPRFEHLMSSGIHSVEILRGPQGLMYGADAGGVININTEAPIEGVSGNLSAETGRYDTEQLAADINGGNGTLDFNLALSDFTTDGFNARTTDTVLQDKDGYQNTTGHGRLGWDVTDSLRLQLVARDISGNNAYDDAFGIAHQRSDHYDQAAWRLAADYKLGNFTHALSYNKNNTKRDAYTVDTLDYHTKGELERWSYIGSFSPSAGRKLVYGADFKTESINSDYRATRDHSGYYLEYQGKVNTQLFFTAGLRHDTNEDFGGHTSYRVSSAYLFNGDYGELKLKGAYGTGFRAPSLYEIGYNNGSVAFPPASLVRLKEEQSRGYDIGLSWYSTSGILLEAVYFDQTVSNQIVFDLINNSGFIQASGESKSQGIELIGEWPLGESFSLESNYTYNDTDDGEGNVRVRRPKHLFNLGVNWRALRDRLILGMNLRGSYEALDIDGEPLDNYSVIDVNASFEMLDGFFIFARVENLMDEDYQEVSTYYTSGAAAYAGVRYTF